MESVWGGMEGLPSFPNRTALVRSDDRVDAGPLPQSNKNTTFCLCSLLHDSPSHITSIFSRRHSTWAVGCSRKADDLAALFYVSTPWR